MSKKKLLIIIVVAVGLLLCAALLMIKWIGKDSGNEIQKTEDDIKYMTIETPCGKLYYPQQWENRVRFDVTETTLICYGMLEGHDAVALFDVYFGKEDGYPIGMIGETPVNVKSYSLDLDESWTSEEKQILYAMQEDINYLIEKLQELDNFTPAK